MSRYKCGHCGATCDENELDYEEWDEPRGEFWGSPCSEHMVELRCPYCGSDDIDEYYVDEEDEDGE